MSKLSSVLLLLIVSISISACSTVSGVGKDLQKAGKVLQKEANKNK